MLLQQGSRICTGLCSRSPTKTARSLPDASRSTDEPGVWPGADSRWRVILAATLLRDTPDTIAGRVGYGSPYALSHAFEREFGITPGRYRAKATDRSAPTTSPRVLN